MTRHEKFVALRNYYEQKGFSKTDAARFANNALLLIGLDIPLSPETAAEVERMAIEPHWSSDWQLFFAE